LPVQASVAAFPALRYRLNWRITSKDLAIARLARSAHGTAL
jgi:hypothetical protein